MNKKTNFLYNDIIYLYCTSNNYYRLQKFLQDQSNDIDILYMEGLFFGIAISFNRIELLKVLLDFYENTKLCGNVESIEYKHARYKLQNILQDAVDSVCEISPEIQELIKPYISLEENSDTDQDLSEFEELSLNFDSPSESTTEEDNSDDTTFKASSELLGIEDFSH